jgi:hypothetical protein
MKVHFIHFPGKKAICIAEDSMLHDMRRNMAVDGVSFEEINSSYLTKSIGTPLS